MPVYINLVDVRDGGKEMAVYFRHMTVRITGIGLDALAEGLRRQVIPSRLARVSRFSFP